MVEVDYVEPGIVVHHSEVLDTREIYQILKNWLENHNYEFLEKEYHDTMKEENRQVMIKWKAFKKVDDYTQFVIEIKIVGSGLKTVKLKNKKVVKGDIQVNFESYLETDYEDRWEVHPLLKIFRGLYDKVILKGQTERHEKELKEDTYTLRQDVKTYLRSEKLN